MAQNLNIFHPKCGKEREDISILQVFVKILFFSVENTQKQILAIIRVSSIFLNFKNKISIHSDLTLTSTRLFYNPSKITSIITPEGNVLPRPLCIISFVCTTKRDIIFRWIHIICVSSSIKVTKLFFIIIDVFGGYNHFGFLCTFLLLLF